VAYRLRKKPGTVPTHRTRKRITDADVERVRELAETGATQREVAIELGCCPETIYRNPKIAAAYDEGFNRFCLFIRRAQLQCAKRNVPAMLIWLGKQYLNQRDNPGLAQELSQEVKELIIRQSEQLLQQAEQQLRQSEQQQSSESAPASPQSEQPATS